MAAKQQWWRFSTNIVQKTRSLFHPSSHGPFVDITNVINAKLINKRAAVIQCEINVPKDHENCQQINKNSTSKIQRASTIGFGIILILAFFS
uniref:Uncharacterized protein n=1 Tax=Oryza nivara TaxID=4536 RepID=A0A0E0IAT3_ORYNI